MRPLTVITGIVLGSSFSVAFSLAAVLLMFLLLSDDYPRLDYEFRGLVVSFAMFLTMTMVSAWSFYWTLNEHRARAAAQAVMWMSLLAVGYYYWP